MLSLIRSDTEMDIGTSFITNPTYTAFNWYLVAHIYILGFKGDLNKDQEYVA